MICELVIQDLPEGISEQELCTFANGTLARWRNNSELISKHYLVSEDGRGAGFYVWPSLDAAKRGHDEEWCAAVERRTGRRPVIQYFDLFMLLDNVRNVVLETPNFEITHLFDSKTDSP